mgnify:CR=1 FL=1
MRFSEIMYQTTSGASAGNGASGTGGKNAKQIGLGVSRVPLLQILPEPVPLRLPVIHLILD